MIIISLHFFVVNLAFNKTAWQTTPYHDFYPANRAVDGEKTKLSRHDGSCAVTEFWNPPNSAEWRVDLGQISSIRHIFIQFETMNVKWGIICKVSFAIVFRDRFAKTTYKFNTSF